MICLPRLFSMLRFLGSAQDQTGFTQTMRLDGASAGSGNDGGTQCTNADGNAEVQMTVEQKTSSQTLGRKPGVFE